jgi:hypothetical protein
MPGGVSESVSRSPRGKKAEVTVETLGRVDRSNRWDFNPDFAEVINGTSPVAPHLHDEGPDLIVSAR